MRGKWAKLGTRGEEGLCNSASGFLPGFLPKPTIWAEPALVIPSGSSVTIWCQGTMEAQEYYLYAGDIYPALERQKSFEPRNKAKFIMKHIYPGIYHCSYHSLAGWSECSDPLELVMTGEKTLMVSASDFALSKEVCTQGVSPLTAQP